MKFQCSVCGQIINTNESCPICGSSKDKIISLGDDENSVTYRCLSCGRVFENRDVCPHCGGEDLFDLTHDKIFNRNEVKKEEKEEVPIQDEELDLFSSFSNLNEEDRFEDKPVDVSKVEIKEEVKEEEVIEDPFDDEESLIKDDDYENSEIITNYEDLDEDEVIEKEEDISSSKSLDETIADDIENEFPFDYDFEEESDENETSEDSVNEDESEDESSFEFFDEEDDLESKEDFEEEPLEEEKVEFFDNLQETPLDNEDIKEEQVQEEVAHEEEVAPLKKEESTLDKTALYNEILLNILFSQDVKIETNSELINKVLSSLKEEIEALNLYKEEDLISLMHKKLDIDKEIFAKDASPLNGHILYEDELIISKFKKD